MQLNDNDVIYTVSNNKLRKILTGAIMSESFEKINWTINANLAKKKSFWTRVSKFNDILKFQCSLHLYLNVRNSIMHTDRELEVFNLQNQTLF